VRTFIAEGHRQRRLQRRSRSATVVVLQHATKAITALDPASNRISIILRLDELVAEALMVSLAMIMLDVFTNGVLK
jgi:hypothetical protein